MHPGRYENKKILTKQSPRYPFHVQFRMSPYFIKTKIYKIDAKEAPLTTILKTGVLKKKSNLTRVHGGV